MGSVGQYTQGWLPWQGTKTNTNMSTRNNLSTYLGMGDLESSGAQNDECTWDVWLDQGTWKVAIVHHQSTNRGIYTVSLDGTTLGTIDGYAAASTLNVYSEITGIVLTTPSAARNLKIKMATKNASSSNYFAVFQSVALIRTSGTGSIGANNDTPGYTWHYLPWMGSKATTNWSTLTQASGNLGGGWLESSGAQNAEVSFDVWLDSGTYKFALIYGKGSTSGIFSVQLDSVEKGTIDAYNAAPSDDNYSEITGIAVTAGLKTFKLKMATKNASSSNYFGTAQSVAWMRTGA